MVTLLPCDSCHGTLKIKRYDGYEQECGCISGTEGCFNKSADAAKRNDKTWSDTNLNDEFGSEKEFDRLKCGGCGGICFEVIITGDYETTAKCLFCNAYYIVHTG